MQTLARIAVWSGVLSSVCACTSDAEPLTEPEPLLITGEYRGVGFELRLRKAVDTNQEGARLECVFHFEDPATFAGGAFPSNVSWTTDSGDRFDGPLISPTGQDARDDEHIVRFEIEVPASASGGHLSFDMSGLAFPRLERGSRGLRIDLSDKVVPMAMAP